MVRKYPNLREISDSQACEIVREFIDYNSETGVFTWKYRDLKWSRAAWFNSDRGGKEITGSKTGAGYLSFGLCLGRFYLHRIAYLHYYGKWPDSQIDHIDGDKTNNRISNLRDVTHQENHKNMPIQKNSPHRTPGCVNPSQLISFIWLC